MEAGVENWGNYMKQMAPDSCNTCKFFVYSYVLKVLSRTLFNKLLIILIIIQLKHILSIYYMSEF